MSDVPAEDESWSERRARERVGTMLRGKYKLDRVLGFGGMAVVYAATHRNQAELAVKMLHPELSVNKEIRARFQREGYVANSVKHPGAVLVVDDDVAEDGSAFLVMEMLNGASVDELADRHGGKLPVKIAMIIAHELLDVLAAAHAKSIVHRDIKPANVFVTREGVVKVLDVGIARIRDATLGSSHATSTGTMMGTPAFMSPEQALAETANIDQQSDVWSVGALLFTLISGALVHEAATAPALLVKTATERPRSLAKVAPEAPARVAAIVDRALAFEKASRWPRAADMRDALKEAYRATFGAPLERSSLLGLFEGVDAATEPPAPAAPTVLAATTPLPSVRSDLRTAVPVSHDATPVPTKTKGKAVIAIAALVAAAIAIVVVVVVAMAARKSPDVVASAASVVTAATPVVSNAPAIAASEAPVVLAAAATTTTTTTTAAVIDAPKVLGARAPHATASASAVPVVVARDAGAPSSKNPCDPNYYFDAEGNRHFKLECFR
jgi:serine/threonine-protein kinase